jgi:hypothetical protein
LHDRIKGSVAARKCRGGRHWRHERWKLPAPTVAASLGFLDAVEKLDLRGFRGLTGDFSGRRKS